MRTKPNAVDVAPIIFPGVNGCAVCDCGNLSFRVGVGSDEIGNNQIRCLECSKCGHRVAVPFFHDGLR